MSGTRGVEYGRGLRVSAGLTILMVNGEWDSMRADLRFTQLLAGRETLTTAARNQRTETKCEKREHKERREHREKEKKE